MTDRGLIVLVSHAREVGGAELHLERLIQFLLDSGESVALVCRPDRALDAFADRIGAAGAPVHRLELSRPAGAARLLRLLRSARLVHLHLAHPVGKYQLLAAMIARLLRRPSVATHHLVLEAEQIPVGAWRRAAWMRVFFLYRSLIDRHISISAFGKQMLTGRYGFDPARVSVIYNGIDPARFIPATPAERAVLAGRLLSELSGSSPARGALICTIARLNAQKGLFDLVEAAASLRRDFPDNHYVVIGEGELRQSLEAALLSAGLERAFFLAGPRTPEQVAQWLRAADLFVLPSHFEGGPAIALMEAMAAACAAIATRVSGTDELIDSEEVGSLVPPGRPEAIAAAIRDLLNDPERRQRLAQRARQRVIAGFDIRRSHRQTLELYRELAR